ncbi:MAG TPA: hypothetical protein IAA06_00575 [Candidatus Blautia faecavium]|uniref:Uncharacterized protein n=1 Tax=Candidatus Blautia faecavium TaxID=2838487 RepID=A0A9D2LQG7_9FIRM|nr:hypothetical protein [Candidatus Blautia faecavium]
MKGITKNIYGSAGMIIAKFNISGPAGLMLFVRMEKSVRGNITEQHSKSGSPFRMIRVD